MTRTRRRILLLFSILIFAAGIAPVILYSLGYRFSFESWRFVHAGGFSISTSPAIGARVYVNGKLNKETSLLSRRVFIQGLTPRTYTVQIEKDGYFTWEKSLPVYPERVTDIEALLIPKDTQGTVIGRGVYTSLEFTDRSETLLTLKDTKLHDFYYSLDESRFVPKPPVIATTTPNLSASAKAFIKDRGIINFDYDASGERIVWRDENHIWMRWLRGENFLPLYTEKEEELIYTSPTPIREVRFYPREEAILASLSNGIWVIELDGRDKRAINPLYKGKQPIFEVSKGDEKTYILDDGTFIVVPLA